MKTVVVIGIGNLGMRHLQAICQLANIRIIAIDPSAGAIEKAKSILECNTEHIVFYTDLSSLRENVDVAIIATDSSIRKHVITELISRVKVEYLILEKVLFQYKSDYYEIGALLKENNVKAWVNCPRRSVDFYKMLKHLFINASYINLSFTGTLWGIGCSSIHFIDLLAYLTGTAHNLIVSVQGLDNEIITSKRSGFVEFTGELTGTINDINHFSLISNKFGMEPLIITLNSNVTSCIINESEGLAVLKKVENNWEEEKIVFKMPYQSQLTDKIISQIFETGGCDLTSYDESVKLHIPLIESLLNKINEQGYFTDCCNIT